MLSLLARAGRRGAPRLRGLCAASAAAEMPEARFHELADRALGALQEAAEQLEDADLDLDLDVSNSMGVLRVVIDGHGTWVVNKQTPNRQLWWSSPLSGPRRFELSAGGGPQRWRFTRDEAVDLYELLEEELEKVTGTRVTAEE